MLNKYIIGFIIILVIFFIIKNNEYFLDCPDNKPIKDENGKTVYCGLKDDGTYEPCIAKPIFKNGKCYSCGPNAIPKNGRCLAKDEVLN